MTYRPIFEIYFNIISPSTSRSYERLLGFTFPSFVDSKQGKYFYSREKVDGQKHGGIRDCLTSE
jgi:hypothetical protein